MTNKKQTTIKIRRPTREKLQKLSKETGESMVSILERIVDAEVSRVWLKTSKDD